jgi:cell wall-active antibiotic response 4TMS protein YvqF
MRHARTLEGPYILIPIGAVLLLWNFGYNPRDWGQWWPVLLIVLGVLAIVMRAQEPAPASRRRIFIHSTYERAAPPVAPGSASPEPARRRRRIGGGVFLIGLGAAFLLSNAVGRGSFPAFVLIAIGLSSLVNRYW